MPDSRWSSVNLNDTQGMSPAEKIAFWIGDHYDRYVVNEETKADFEAAAKLAEVELLSYAVDVLIGISSKLNELERMD